MTTIEKIESMIEGLQRLLVLLQANPQLEKFVYFHSRDTSIHIYGKSKEKKTEFSGLVRTLSKGVGKLAKEYTDYNCKVVRAFSPMITLTVSIEREAVCKRIVKEVKEVAGYYVQPHKEEVVEWKCK